ncbi:MAG: hypothetical protein ACI9YL_001720 [Luteibaculaceae bacterium]
MQNSPNHVLDQWGQVVQTLDPITLSEMDGVKLMKRVDTKFVVSYAVAMEWMQNLGAHYRVLDINGNRIQTYNTRYFDTADLYFYTMHHNSRSNRFKVRKRNYRESNLAFLEIKRKDNKKVTHKNRIKTPEDQFDLLPEDEAAFIAKTIGKEMELFPVIDTHFKRITLASELFQERITVDLELHFETSDVEKKPEGIVVIELKQPKFNPNSPAFIALRNYGVRKSSMSKYCIGMAMCKPHLKHNAFKAKLREIEKLKK